VVKTATTLDQYSGLNCSGVSTMMNLMGRVVSIDGRRREMCRIEAEELDVEVEESAGMYVPLSRNDLIFDIRSSEEAEGERRTIGSGLRTGAFGLWARVVLFAAFAAAV
jgi:hypothetical protein